MMGAVRRWASCFLFGFWSHKKTVEAGRRGYGNTFLSFLLAVAFLLFGVFAADMLPFRTHYRAAGDYRAFIAHALARQTEESALTLCLQDGKLSVTDPASGMPMVVDTVADPEQARQYALNGYHLVVDTRPADTPDDFEPYYLANDGTGDEITCEEYESLSSVARRNFDFKIRYTGRELILTEERLAGYEAYLQSAGDADAAALTQLRESRGEQGEDAYRRGVYTLYVKTRFPDMTTYETSSEIPLLRNYYLYEYVNSAAVTDYLFLFEDAVVGAYSTDNGHRVSFYGFYDSEQSGVVIPAGTEPGEADDLAVRFVQDCFYETTSFDLYLWGTSFLQLTPYLVLMPVVVGLLLLCMIRLLKIDPQRGFGVCFREVGIWLWQAGLLAAVAIFAIGFAAERRLLQPLVLLILFSVLLLRAGLSVVCEKRQSRQAESLRGETEPTPKSIMNEEQDSL